MDKSRYKVKNLIGDIKKRWRRRVINQGSAIAIFTFIFFAIVYLLLNNRFDIPPFAESIGFGIAVLVIGLVIYQFIIRPGFRNITDRQLALYVEEKIPELEDRINSAVELDEVSAKRERDILIDKLIDDAAEKAKSIRITTIVDRKKERIVSYSSYALLFIFALFVFTQWDNITKVISDFDLSLERLADTLDNTFASISPGTIEIEKGSSQGIVVDLMQESDFDVVIHYKSGEDIWKKQIMNKGIDDPIYLYQFFNVQEPIDYFVELNEERSDVFAIFLYEFSKVTNIDLTYTYPEYTKVPDRTEENTGTIRGLKGSKVTVTIETTGSAKKSDMILESGGIIAFKPIGDGKFQGSLILDEPDEYEIKLTDEQNKNNKFPVRYRIIPLEDEQPLITITDPQRDIRANPIEEVLMAVIVTDDFGVEDVRLRYAVNGEDEQTANLMQASAKGEERFSGSYLFMLEDHSLQPGDFISYYVEAEDNFHIDDPEQTDMYFIEIAPFEATFTQVNNQRQQGGGGGRQSQIVLNQQQIIAATWKLHRVGGEMENDEFNETLDALVQAQSNLKDNIEERINSTAFSMEMLEEEINRKIAGFLREAVKKMDNALDELNGIKLREALTPERKALNNLLKADALNEDKRVQQQRQQTGQGGQQNRAQQDRMTELQDLELDLSKDKYELQQQRRQEQQDQQIEDTLNKIEELARKQQKLAEQSRQALQEENNKRTAEQLRREQEQLEQQAQEIADQMRRQSRNNPEINQQMQERLEQAAQNMREASQALRENNLQQAQSSQRQAINELNRLQQDLRMTRAENTRDFVERFREGFQQFKELENQLDRDLDLTFNEMKQTQRNRPEPEDRKRLSQKRENMIDNMERLQNLARAIEERAEAENPKVAIDMRNFLRALQREDLDASMDDSQQALDQGAYQWAQWIESEIQTSLDRLTTEVKNLESEFPLTDAEKIMENLQGVRDQLTRFEDIIGQNRRNQESAQSNEQRQGQQGNESQQNQQGQQGRQGQRMARGGNRGGNNPSQEQMNRANAAQFRNEVNRAEELLDRMQRDFANDRGMQQDIRNARNALGRMHNIGVLLDKASVEFFKETVRESMSAVEERLLDRISALELEEKLYEARHSDVPPEYKKILEKYFEALSKSTNKTNKIKKDR